jgi:hypothetical protein
MKKITLIIAAAFLAANLWSAEPTWTRVWENSATYSTLPTYIGTASNVRGMGIGTFESEKVVVIPTREGGTAVKLLKASDGTEWKNLDVTGISGGTFAVSDAGVTSDGKILVCNMVMSAAAVFKVYRWDNSTDAPTVAISYTLDAAHRIGDHFTVKGSIADGSAKVYAFSTTLVNTKATLFRFDMVSDGNGSYVFNNTPTIITNQIAATSGYNSVDLMPDGKYIYKYNGSQILKLNADGSNPSPTESSSSAIIATGGNSVRYLMTRTAVNTGDPDTAYIAYFRYGTGQERANIVKFPGGILNSAGTAISTYLPALGTNANGNGAGRVAFDDLTANSLNLYVLSTNNGIGKYTITWPTITTSAVNVEESLKIVKTSSLLKVEGTTPSYIELYNTLGQKVQSANNTNEIDINNLRGVHIIKVNVKGIINTQKISL